MSEVALDPTARVASLLLEPTVKTSIRVTYERILTSVGNRRAGRTAVSEPWTFAEAELSLSLSRAVATACEAEGPIRTLFRKRVVPRLGRPNLVTEDDLCAAFRATIRTEIADFDLAYRLFVGQVVNLVEQAEYLLHLTFCWHSRTASPARMHGAGRADTDDELARPPDEDQRLFDLDDLEPLWSRNGVTLRLEVAPASMAADKDKHWPTGMRLLRLGVIVQGAAANALISVQELLGECLEVIAACVDASESLHPVALSIERISDERATINELSNCD